MIRPGIEPRSHSSLANTLPTRQITGISILEEGYCHTQDIFYSVEPYDSSKNAVGLSESPEIGWQNEFTSNSIQQRIK